MSRALRAVAIVALAASCKGEASRTRATSHDDEGEPGHGKAADGEAKEGAHADEGEVVHLTAEQVKAAAIATATAEVRREAALLEATGQIEAAADRQARIGARVSGRVSTLKAGVGDRVKKGQALAVVDSPELGRAKADYLAARAAADVAKQTAEREKQLFERKISAEKDWRQAEAEAIRASADKEAAENRLHALGVSEAGLPSAVRHFSSTTTAASPIDGVIVERPVTLGEMVDPDDTLFVVMDLREVWLGIDVFERDLGQVIVGQKARVQVAAYAERAFEGTVSSIGAVVEPRTRAVKVRVVLPNAEGQLKPGMFARVQLADTQGQEHEHVFVPVAAVQRSGRRRIVFVPSEEPGEYLVREVETGHEVGGWIAVDRGLEQGEAVVTSGSFVLKSELGKDELGESGHSH